ncbi:hypothetical protein [Actinoplanes subglobosus]|uniref:Uncharacterized protein n=1 Tax=Actinoplanes subglobosus TaxID=1547892 RepID=A0ABV8IVP2_9ACTN
MRRRLIEFTVRSARKVGRRARIVGELLMAHWRTIAGWTVVLVVVALVVAGQGRVRPAAHFLLFWFLCLVAVAAVLVAGRRWPIDALLAMAAGASALAWIVRYPPEEGVASSVLAEGGVMGQFHPALENTQGGLADQLPWPANDILSALLCVVMGSASAVVAWRCRVRTSVPILVLAGMILEVVPDPTPYSAVVFPNWRAVAIPAAPLLLLRWWRAPTRAACPATALTLPAPLLRQAAPEVPDASDDSGPANWIGAVSAMVALAGLLLFVPIHFGYSAFYSQYGLQPEDVGIGYAQAITLQLDRILLASIALAVVLAVTVALVVNAVNKRGLSLFRVRFGVVPSPASRRACAVATVTVLLLAGFYVRERIQPPYYSENGIPVNPEQSSFLNLRTTVVEATWVADGPTPALPRRMLKLATVNGETIFWNNVTSNVVTVPSEAVVMTNLSSTAISVYGRREFGTPASGWMMFDAEANPLRLEGLQKTLSLDRNCWPTNDWLTGLAYDRGLVLTAVFPPEYRRYGLEGPAPYLLYGPGYRLLNADLLAAGAEPETAAWFPSPSIEAEMRQAAERGQRIRAGTESCKTD